MHDERVKLSRIIAGYRANLRVAHGLVERLCLLVIDSNFQANRLHCLRLKVLFNCAQQQAAYSLSPHVRKHIDGNDMPETLTFVHVFLHHTESNDVARIVFGDNFPAAETC